MSLESGRRLGLISSLIIVILPVIFIPVILFLVFSSIASYPFTPGSSPLAFPFTILLYALVGIASFVSFILFVLAMHRLADYYHEPGIFKNALYGFIVNIIGTVVAYGINFAYFSNTLRGLAQSGTPSAAAASMFLQVFVAAIILLVVVFGFAIVSAVFYMLAFNKLAEKSGVNNFKTAGLLMLIGFVLVIVLVGILLVWVAWIIAAIGFYSLKAHANSTLPAVSQQTAASNAKYCPYCGTENDANALYCKNCGKQIK